MTDPSEQAPQASRVEKAPQASRVTAARALDPQRRIGVIAGAVGLLAGVAALALLAVGAPMGFPIAGVLLAVAAVIVLVVVRPRPSRVVTPPGAGIWEYDPVADTITLNATAQEMLGLEVNEAGDVITIDGSEYLGSCVPVNDRARVRALLRGAPNPDDAAKARIGFEHAEREGTDGIVAVRAQWDARAGSDGRYVGVLVSVSDSVTFHRVAASFVRATRESVVAINRSDLSASGGALVQAVTADGTITYVNDAWLKRLNYRRDEAIGMNFSAVLGTGMVEHCVALLGRILTDGGGSFIKVALRARGGEAVHVEGFAVKSVPLEPGQPPRTLAILHDVSSQVAALSNMDSRLAQAGEALEIAELGDWSYSAARDEFTFSDALFRVIGWTPEGLGGYVVPARRYAREVVHASETDVVPAGLAAGLGYDGDDPFDGHLMHRFVREDGSEGVLEVRYGLRRNKDGAIVGLVGVNRDITTIKDADEALERSRAANVTLTRRLERAIEAAAIGVFQVSFPSRTVLCNDVMKASRGYKNGQRLDWPGTYDGFLQAVSPVDRDAVIEALEGTHVGEGFEVEYTLLALDGSQHRIKSWGTVEDEPHGAPNARTVVGMEVDVTKERLEANVLEDRLASQADELRYLSRLTQPHSRITASSYATGPLRERAADEFASAVKLYEKFLESAEKESVYKGASLLAAEVQQAAAALGALQAQARDVIDVHVAALSCRTIGLTEQRSSLVAAEGRLLLVRVLGYLADYYRLNSQFSVAGGGSRLSFRSGGQIEAGDTSPGLESKQETSQHD